RQLGRRRQQAQGGQRRYRLARAAFTDQRQRFARRDVKADPAHRRMSAKAHRQVADRKQRRAHAKVFRGSKASRTASPINTSRVSISAMVKKPVRPSQGACKLFLPCASNSPSEGEPGGRPKPRKSSEVSVATEPDRMNGMKVSVATMALGSRCLIMMVRLDTPSVRAAATYSKLRARRNSARTIPTS